MPTEKDLLKEMVDLMKEMVDLTKGVHKELREVRVRLYELNK